MKKLLILSITLLAWSCGSKASEEQAEVLKKEVFKVHDDVMPLTMKIEDIQTSIRAKVEKDTTLKAKGLALNSAMQAASDSMYVWMNALSDLEGKDAAQKIEMLQKLKLKGEAIKVATSQSIGDAEGFLK